jgi:hypothetical protein
MGNVVLFLARPEALAELVKQSGIGSSIKKKKPNKMLGSFKYIG